MTIPRQGSVNGEHGFPVVKAERVRVRVNGDMHRGVVAYDIAEGWADCLEWGEHGEMIKLGDGYKIRRYRGKVEVFEV